MAPRTPSPCKRLGYAACMTPPSIPPKPNAGWTLIGRVKAGFLILTVLLAMVACVGLQPLLKGIAVEQNLKVEGFAVLFLEKPWIGVLLGIPALASCIPLIRGSRHPLLWMTVATLLLLLPFAFLLLGFLGVIAPLYEYRPL